MVLHDYFQSMYCLFKLQASPRITLHFHCSSIAHRLLSQTADRLKQFFSKLQQLRTTLLAVPFKKKDNTIS